ncbi:MAG: hypothetical protein AAFY45_19130 [Bacteroidota bacterium]
MKAYFLIIYLLFSGISLFSQDLIIFRDVDEKDIRAKVKAVKSNHITYTPFDEPNIKPIKLAKHKIELIIFEDGMKQYFAAQDYEPDTLVFSTPGSNLQSLDPRGFYYQGTEDARSTYKGNGPLWGTLLASAVPGYGVLGGAITGGIIAAVPPKVDPYQLPDPDLYLNNSEYARGYDRQVMRKKLGRVLTGYGVGIAIQTVIIVIIVSSW